MASKELWKGIGVAGEREPPTYSAHSPNQLSKGPRKGKGGGVAPGALSKSLKKASSKRKSNIEAQNSVAATENKCSNSEALKKEKEWMYDYEEGFGHNHQKCIERRRNLWGPRADSPPPSPIPIEVFFPLYPPELVAELNKQQELDIQEAMSIHELEIQKVLAKMDALKAQKLSPPTPPNVSEG